MYINELMQYVNNNKKQLDWSGVAQNSRHIPPLIDTMSVFFNLRNFSSLAEIEKNLIEAKKNPQLLNSLVTQNFLSLPVEIQTVLYNWLELMIQPYEQYRSVAIKSAITSSLVDLEDGGSDSVLKNTNIASISSSDIPKRIASVVGTEFMIDISSDIKSRLRTLLPTIISMVINAQLDQPTKENIVFLFFNLLVLTDGFIEENIIMDLMRDVALKDPTNITTAEKVLNKASASSSGLNVYFDQKTAQINLANLPLMSVTDTIRLVEGITQGITNEIVNSGILNGRNDGNQIITNLINILKEALLTVVPVSILEDIVSVSDKKPLKATLSEMKGVHLNALMTQQQLITIGYASIPNTALVMSYIVISLLYKSNPGVITNITNIAPNLNALIQSLGLFPIQNNVQICIGKINVEDVIRIDFDCNNGGLYTMTYGQLVNDKSLLQPGVAVLFQSSNVTSAKAVYDYIVRAYPAIMNNRQSQINLEFIEMYLSTVQLSNITSASTPSMRDVLMKYCNYLKKEIARMETQGR